MSEAERERVLAELPLAITDAEMSPPEGDEHYEAKNEVRETLRAWFARRGERVYVAAELTVYYPAEPRFAPDVLAVRDVEVRNRTRWVVSAEGKGLDWVMEVHCGGDRKKDAETNVIRYARLGIREYFIYDRARQRVHGYRLPAPGARAYEPIVPQQGRYPSAVLDLELAVEDGRLRFYHANAQLLTAREWVEKLGELVAQVSAERDAEAERARQEAERAAAAEAQLERLRAELEALRKR